MTSLQLLWFVLIGVLFAGFFFLEGFDFGVGISTWFVAKDDREIDQAITAIGPHWDGNEVWLLTAGGAMFASFPFWYASLFSGYYLVLLLILVGLIFRGVSFEFRHRGVNSKHKIFWTRVLGISSLFVPFMLGLMFTSFIQGMPMDREGNVVGGFFDYVNLLSLVGGLATVILSWLHGLNFLSLKVDGPLRENAKKQANLLYYFLYAGEVSFAILLLVYTDFFDKHGALTIFLLGLIVLLTLLAHLSVRAGRERLAFLGSGLTFLVLVALLFQGIFPRVMISADGQHDILIKNASSTEYTLTAMSIVALCILPFVLVYIGWSYFIFRKRIRK